MKREFTLTVKDGKFHAVDEDGEQLDLATFLVGPQSYEVSVIKEGTAISFVPFPLMIYEQSTTVP